jgi:hypothetical protein
MSVIAPLLAVLHFLHFEAKNMSVFSREYLEKNVNTRPSGSRFAFSTSSEHEKSERA